MARRPRHADVNLYLPHVVVATGLIVVLPSAATIAASWQFDWPAIVAVLLGVTTSILLAIVGARWWSRRPQSVDLSFGELMVWGWLKRKKAEKDLRRVQGLLEAESGRPHHINLTPEQKLALLRQLSSALESKDPYTHGHSRRVERHVARIANALQLSDDDTTALRRAASLHDVGKIRVPDTILKKPAQLTIEERVLMQEHTLVGAWMVAGVGSDEVVLAVRHHHERWDGRGYPDGLAADSIPVLARIIAVADAFDAMTSARPYRPPRSRDHAVRVLVEESGRQFDPDAVEAFISTLGRTVPAGLFAGPAIAAGRWAREFNDWATRVGATKIGAAAATVGVASLLGTAALSPPANIQQTTRPPNLSAPAAPAHRGTKAAPHSKVAGKRITRASVTRTHARSSTPTKPTASSGTVTRTGSSRTAPRPATHTIRSHPAPTENDNASGAKGDPQPDHGRDCNDHPGQGEGGGNTKHCDG